MTESIGEPVDESAAGERRRSDALLRIGALGSLIVALCCFTPVLAILLGAVGLSAALGWLDLVLLPALAAFLGIMTYALWKRRKVT